MKVLAIVSGGMDSVTMLYDYVHQGHDVDVVAFYYKQRHSRELECSQLHAERLGCRFDAVDISAMQPHLTGSALTDDAVPVPHGHYAEESMRKTVVPNRNAIFLSIAFGIAISRSCDIVATAVHGGDHHIYPDCRPEFIEALSSSLALGMVGHHAGLRIEAPYINTDKTGIARIGKTLNVPYHETWTCYEGGRYHCGRCGACVERREAFELAGVADQTKYLCDLQTRFHW